MVARPVGGNERWDYACNVTLQNIFRRCPNILRGVTGRAIGDRPYGGVPKQFSLRGKCNVTSQFGSSIFRRGDHWSPALLAEQSAGLTPSKQSHFFISSFLHFFISSFLHFSYDRPYGNAQQCTFPHENCGHSTKFSFFLSINTHIRRGDHWSPALLAEQSAGLTPSKQSHFFIPSFLHFFISSFFL